ncbi:putative ankyrin repeat protein RF_0381 [Microplitis mediator]|uniref:putative ankyrin repeat protein RF_0381 n=1 Tax=Microplitis mediator TaxID=375433 RepID=UPI002553E2FF|nr:putative ankyrin repeat protein RF_0381 [Microplitis mediator]
MSEQKKLRVENIENKHIKFYIEAHNVYINMRFIYNSIIEDWTFLHTAVDQSDEDLVEYLLEKGADPNINVKIYGTPLHVAVKKGNLDIIKNLLKHGADINVRGDMCENFTVLEYAVQHDNIEAYKILTDRVNMLDPVLMCIALKYNSKKILDAYLTENIEANYRSKDYGSLLHCAVHSNNLDAIERLIKYGADINYACSYNNGTGLWDYSDLTALQIAVIFNKMKAVKLLVQKHADVNICADDDEAALSLAISMTCHDDVINDLLYAGADIGKIDLSKYVGRESIKKLIKKQAVKLNVAKLYVSEKHLETIADDRELIDFRNRCIEEIEDMKKIKISMSGVNFYSLLRKNYHQLALYAKNDVIRSAVLETDFLGTHFPLYAGIVSSRFRKGLERKNLLVKIENFVFDVFHDLPDTFVRNIFLYLSNGDLESLQSRL